MPTQIALSCPSCMTRLSACPSCDLVRCGCLGKISTCHADRQHWDDEGQRIPNEPTLIDWNEPDRIKARRWSRRA